MSSSAIKRKGTGNDATLTFSCSIKKAKSEPETIEDVYKEMIAKNAEYNNKKPSLLLQSDGWADIADLTPPLAPLRPFSPPPPPPPPLLQPLPLFDALQGKEKPWKISCNPFNSAPFHPSPPTSSPPPPIHKPSVISCDPLMSVQDFGKCPPLGRKDLHSLAQTAFPAFACTGAAGCATLNGLDEANNSIEDFPGLPQEGGSSRPLPISNKARQLLEMANTLHNDMQSKIGGGAFQGSINLVAASDLLYTVECMIQMQDIFRVENKPTRVDVGYHYTKSSNMQNIHLGGLMTREERRAYNMDNDFNGAVYGDGIYTGNNPFAFHRFGNGDIGLLVARLQGQTEQATSRGVLRRRGAPINDNKSDANTGIAGAGDRAIIVLRSSLQCVALIQFDASLIDPSNGDSPGCNIVHEYHVRLQKILDAILNDGYETSVPKFQPRIPYPRRFRGRNPPMKGQPTEQVVYKAPDKIESGCLLLDCLGPSENSSSACPLCLSNLQEQQGTMPSGTMAISRLPQVTCVGHAPGTIGIDYNMEGGIQKDYHQNPGCSFSGTFRTAYVPDNDEGRDLLKRLKWAFSHGLTFTVGTSLTTKRHNVITWASIPHKSTTSRGRFGFPDRFYFATCNRELDSLQVPSAKDL